MEREVSLQGGLNITRRCGALRQKRMMIMIRIEMILIRWEKCAKKTAGVDGDGTSEEVGSSLYL